MAVVRPMAASVTFRLMQVTEKNGYICVDAGGDERCTMSIQQARDLARRIVQLADDIESFERAKQDGLTPAKTFNDE